MQMGFIPGHEKVQGNVGVAVCNSKKYMACIENVEDTEAQQVRGWNMCEPECVNHPLDISRILGPCVITASHCGPLDVQRC